MRKVEVKRYFDKNEKKKELDKELKGLKNKLIADMGNKDQVEVNGGEYEVNYKPYYTYTVDTDKLIQKIADYMNSLTNEEHRAAIEECLEYKVVINEEKLESLIYNGKVPEDIGEDCTVKKETRRFTVKYCNKNK